MTRGRANRAEFDVKTQVAIVRRATDEDGKIHCEVCGIWCPKRADYEIDHRLAEGLRTRADRTRRLVAADGQLLCVAVCHPAKTQVDVGHISLAKRREAKALGLKPPGTAKIPYRGKPTRKPLRVAPGPVGMARRYR